MIQNLDSKVLSKAGRVKREMVMHVLFAGTEVMLICNVACDGVQLRAFDAFLI